MVCTSVVSPVSPGVSFSRILPIHASPARTDKRTDLFAALIAVRNKPDLPRRGVRIRRSRAETKGQNFSRSACRAETKLGPGVFIVGYGSRQEVCPIVGSDGLHPTGRLRPVHVSPLKGQTFSPLQSRSVVFVAGWYIERKWSVLLSCPVAGWYIERKWSVLLSCPFRRPALANPMRSRSGTKGQTSSRSACRADTKYVPVVLIVGYGS
jgi:hypothetical protein